MRILIIEDDEPFARSLEAALVRQGYIAECALDGDQGLERALGLPYDLIVLDVLLPGRSGFEIVRELRANARRTPVLMLTALDALEHRVSGLDSGADDYLVKPFALQELLARVRVQARRQATQLANDLVLKDLSIDLETREVRRGDRPIPLTPREYVLLTTMARHPGRVFTKDELLDRAWPSEVDVNIEIVRVHISNLRKKVDGPGQPAIIHTVHGIGYRVEA